MECLIFFPLMFSESTRYDLTFIYISHDDETYRVNNLLASISLSSLLFVFEYKSLIDYVMFPTSIRFISLFLVVTKPALLMISQRMPSILITR